MTHGFLHTVLFPFVFGLMALFFLVIGLRGIVLKKPFVISSKWMLIVVLLGFTPSVMMSIPASGLGDHRAHVTIFHLLIPAVLIIVGIFLFLALKGYTAFGITDVSFREALMAALTKLNLPYEETLAAVKLPTIGADLQVAVQSWIGTGQLKMKQRQFGTVLRNIVSGMNEYFQRGENLKVNLTCCIFYVLIGVFLLVLAGVFLFAFGKMI